MTEKLKLLVVDDDDAVIDYLRANLGERYDIVSTVSSEHVLYLARKNNPNLILCDIDMPDMDGGDVSRALYSDGDLRDIPVLFITNLVTPSDLKTMVNQIGGRPAVSKRAPLPELVKKIESLIAR